MRTNKPYRIIVYRSNFGHLGRWDRLMNRLWYHTADQERIWAALIFYPLDYMERLWYRIKSL